MRAMTLYNDNLNAGISIIADFGKKGDWESVEAMLEDKVGDIKKMSDLESTIKSFPTLVKDVKFISGRIIKSVRGGRGVEETVFEADNPFAVQTYGYKINNPDEIQISFA